LPLRTHPREVMVKPVGARPRQEVQKCQEDRSGEDYKLFDYVKTAQAASGVPRFLKPVRLKERGAPANFVYEASSPLHKQLQFTCACTARTSTTAEDVERS